LARLHLPTPPTKCSQSPRCPALPPLQFLWPLAISSLAFPP
jgi:hypothetical protein